MDLNNQLVGKADYTNQMNQQYRTADITASLQDLNDQLTAIKNEQADLTQNYNYTIPNSMQVGAEGKGITAGGLAPLTASELRKNQIRQGGVASKALSVSSLMAAYQGKLSTAQNFIDQAVKAKYDPLEAQLSAITKNAEIIKNSPQYSLEDKKRAQALIDQNTAKTAAIQKEKDDKAAIMATALTAAQAGVKADTLAAINSAATPFDALKLASQAGVYTSQEEKTMALNGYTKLRPSQLAGVSEDQILRMPNGDIYRKPSSDIEAIKAIQTKYPDAGIKATDTMEQATAKLQKSQIYKKDINNGKTTFGVIGTDAQGYPVYGFTDTENKVVTPVAPGSSNASSTSIIGDITVTGANGSNLWKPGLDMVIAGGKGAGVKSPEAGEVIFAGKNGGFGNQIKIRTASGEEIWLSHLDSANVKVGDNIEQGQVIGAQGNSGNVYSNGGGDGTHLDLTMKKSDGSFYTAQEVSVKIGVQAKPKVVKGEVQTVKFNGVDYVVGTDGSWSIPKLPGDQKTPDQIEQQKNNLDFLLNTIKDAEGVAGASGRSGARRMFESSVYGATDYTSLQQYADTIKTNLMTLATDPGIKKFFGPQMSNADVQMMQSVASTLNPERQTPAQFKAELVRVKALFDKLKANIGAPTAAAGANSAATVNVVAPDGTAGTIPADQLQDALSQGFKQAN